MSNSDTATPPRLAVCRLAAASSSNGLVPDALARMGLLHERSLLPHTTGNSGERLQA